MNTQKPKVDPKIAQKHKPLRVRFGDRDKTTIRVDFDKEDFTFNRAKYWSHRANNFFGLDGFLILESSKTILKTKDKETDKVICQYSEAGYHIVFNKPARNWGFNMHVVAWLAQQTKSQKLTGYLIMQCIKETSTLRLFPFTKIVYRYGNQDKKIEDFLAFQDFISWAVEKLNRGDKNA